MNQPTVLNQKRAKLRELEGRVNELLEKRNETERILRIAESDDGDFEFTRSATGLLSVVKQVFRPAALPSQLSCEELRQQSGLLHNEYCDARREREAARTDLETYERSLRVLRDNLASLSELD